MTESADGDISGAEDALSTALERAVTAMAGPRSAFQPVWVLRAHLLTRVGRTDEPATARRRALDLTTDPAERDYLSVGLT